MRILTFTALYPSAGRPKHGFVETRLQKLVESGAVAARVVAPCPWFPFSSPRYGRYAEFARIPRVEIRSGLSVAHPRYPVVPKIGMSMAPLLLYSAMLPLLRRQIAEGQDFDLVDAHYFYPDGVAAVMLGQALRRPVVVTARGSDLNIIASHPVPRGWIRWAARRAAGLVTVSSGLKRRLVALGVPAARVRVLRNGVDLCRFRPVDRQAFRRSQRLSGPILLAIGDLVPLKRHRLLVEALVELPGVNLVIAGEGPEKGAIETLARRRDLADRVHLLGWVVQDRLPELYSAADLLLLPSEHEGWPNVLLESMACGTPVVVSNIDGIADIVGAPAVGRILDPTTPATIATAVRELLAAPPARADTRRWSERFDWQSTTQGQIALFQDICRKRAAAPPA
jgi:glycosyltransferase involved in cell wall biosynthesis